MKELVLAAPTAALFAGRPLQGLAVGGGEYLDFLMSPENTRFIPRAAAEEDPSWKQIIPYLVLHCQGRLLLYRRGAGGGEARLRALYSLGFGGHVASGDETLFTGGWQSYLAGARRELEEEIVLAPDAVAGERIVAVINDDSVAVGRVHFGIVHLLELRRPEARKREAQIVAPRWAAVEELAGPGAPALETWSALVLRHWPALAAQPGWEPPGAAAGPWAGR